MQPDPAFGQADLSNCERELIHLAGSVQPHGALLVLREPDLLMQGPGYVLYALMDAVVDRYFPVMDALESELEGIEERLKSRFSWGLTVAIDPPNIEIRVAILLQKAQRSAITLDDTVAFFIAKHVRSNIRELEGALKRVDAYSRFHKRPITVELAKEALKDLLAAQNKQISIENIQKTVADYYRIKPIDLLSKKRTRAIARPRQIAMSLARELTQLSLPEIGAAFGGRDHTTVLHACKTVEELKNLDQAIGADFNALIQILRS